LEPLSDRCNGASEADSSRHVKGVIGSSTAERRYPARPAIQFRSTKTVPIPTVISGPGVCDALLIYRRHIRHDLSFMARRQLCLVQTYMT